jgi:uncharacterized protein (DUF983 family)
MLAATLRGTQVWRHPAELEFAPVHAAATPQRWTATRPATAPGWQRPGIVTAVRRGLSGKCPCCGQGRLFATWLLQAPACEFCHAPLGLIRADDAPPYFVILIVAHLVIAAQVMTDVWLNLSIAAEAAIFLPITLALCLGLLRPVKGATIGLMLQLGMVPDEPVQP